MNPNFISFDTLYAENFYMIDKIEIAKKIYKTIKNVAPFTVGMLQKQISSILQEQNKEDESIKFLKKVLIKLALLVLMKFMIMQDFLKNNDNFMNL